MRERHRVCTATDDNRVPFVDIGMSRSTDDEGGAGGIAPVGDRRADVYVCRRIVRWVSQKGAKGIERFILSAEKENIGVTQREPAGWV